MVASTAGPGREGGPAAGASGHPAERHPGLSSGTRVWLVRHPEVAREHRGVTYGDSDVPLSETGLAEAARLGRSFARLRPAEVASSPLERALEVGIAVSRSAGVPLVVDRRLAEVRRGAWQGRRAAELPQAEVAAYHADPWAWRAPGGESDRDVLERAWPALEEAVRRNPGAEIVVAAHYNVIRVLVARALGVEPARSFSLRLDTGRSVLLLDAAVASDADSDTEAPRRAGWILCRSNVADPADRRSAEAAWVR